MMQLIKKFRDSSLKTQGIIALASLAAYFVSSYILEKSYVLSKFPVPYFDQQTSFDAVKMKEWYAFMIQEGTFDIYLRTQFIDFVFIAAVIVAGFTLSSFISNLNQEGTHIHRWGQRLAFALPLAGAFDILENIVSFFMIANPASFADALVLPYSAFAVIKFGCWTIALLWMMISLMAIPFTRRCVPNVKKMKVA